MEKSVTCLRKDYLTFNKYKTTPVDNIFIKSNLEDEVAENLLAKFMRYHAKNPHVWHEFEKLSLQIAEKHDRYSAWVIIGTLRFRWDLKTTGKPFKISNDYIAIYSRLFSIINPVYKGLFKQKTMKKVNRSIYEGE